MQRILLPVDGSANAERAVKYLIGLAARLKPLEVHLMNVQPPILSGGVRMFVSRETIEGYQQEEGTKALQSARALLDAAGIPYRHHIAVGDIADSIAAYAGKEGCDAIVMGTRGMGSVSNLVLGSVATKVLHLAAVPVTLVK